MYSDSGATTVPLKSWILLGAFLATASAQTNPTAIPRTADGQPNFSGFWDLPYVPNMAQGKEDTVPYTERGRQAYQNHDSKDDPTANCWYPGVPRIMQSPYPMQIVQTRDYLVLLFEYMRMWRSIPLDGREHPKNMEPSFMGDSVGHWEGDTIVIDTVGLKDAPWTWLDTAGHQHSDALHVVERLERKPDSIAYEYTVDDPKMYAKPWIQRRAITPLKITKNLPELIEYSCTENNRDVKHLISTKPALP
jgi:hypothetical protein